ncbi:MAG TPA: malto-oligosyltrehalose synthase [Thermoanaerobaculia bacterium]
MNRYLCIHGHFYQPPRENPWLGTVEPQESAYPYHDWNERVTAECYAPNAASRILDGEGRIERSVNNYSQISFNFGPTLLAWLEVFAPEVYQAVLAADRESRERFSGHGPALAQPYNHTILPLSNRRDKRTQILWGLRDFERRFGRKAEGVWLPETAVDLESLDLLAEAGVRFTILEPHQARRARPKGGQWTDVSGGGIDGTVPYKVALPSGRRIALFFYDGPVSRAVAFEGLLSSGEGFAGRLLSGVPENPDRARLAHIATDGETYGHHHRYGEMALSYAIHHIESHGLARLTNYGEFLERHPPEHEVEIWENTSWSCVHGVDRWRSDCGCHTGGETGWNQAWRAPLRLALDWLRDELAPRFEKEASRIFRDPWAARDDSIEVILDPSSESVDGFFARHAGRQPEGEERARALGLMEMQRHAMLMYTSCGWFFNDLAGIETFQVLRYAGRAVQIAERLFGDSIEKSFLHRLEKARSNVPANGTGRDLYSEHVKPFMADGEGAGPSLAPPLRVSRSLLSTYRLQLRPEFGFDDAAAISDYLADLGVSHVYSSPYLQAARGSTHGYDVIDHSRVNEDLGGEEAHARFCRRLGEHGLGQVLDVVPNHMAIDPKGGEQRNTWWWDVLENGPASRYAGYFDVDWDSPQSRLRNIVLLPILGDHYGRVLEAGEMRLVRQEGKLEIHYFDHWMPVAPRSLDDLLREAARRCGSPDLAFIADACGQLPLATETDRESVARRHRDKEVLAGQLARLCDEKPEVAEAVDAVVEEINADPDRLDELLQRQNYRPAFWRTAGQELDYRRFFDVHTLVGLRTEDERVFADTHARVIDWARRGVLDGLRIDHPDGLLDPEQYFARLHAAAPEAWIVVEKILEPGEPLPEDWPVDGTTGYDFASLVGGLFVDAAGEAPLTDLYTELTGQGAGWPAMVREKKLMVLGELLASDVNRLAEVFLQVCERHRRYRDYTRFELRQAIREVAACFPVYRTYVRAETGEVRERDVRYVDEAIEAARGNWPDLSPDLLDFFRDLLTLKVRGEVESELVMRFQQLTGPAMAKGVEDTSFYNFNRLVSLNEVGGDPGRFGTSLEDFHRACARNQERWPRTMTATSTHDTKRSEDVRVRIHLLSEIPERWGGAVRRWLERNERYRTDGFPDRNLEYLLYQTLVGAWPISADRLLAYLEKAAREAKAYTSWTRTDAGYEEAVKRFVEGLFGDEEFMADLEAFVAPLVAPGRIASLAQTLIRLTAPGVPDTYQGSELWDLSLVDPDNRRPVDYELRRRLLDELKTGLSAEEILARADDGLPKLWVVRQALHLRRRLPEAFGPEGAYWPLRAHGPRADHAVAFMRGDAVIAVAPRLVIGLGGDWGETVLDLPEGTWRNELTGEDVPGGERCLAGLLGRFPAALLARKG